MSAPNRDDLRRRLLRNPAAGYTPTGSAFGAALSYALDGKPYFTFFDVPRMMRDPRVRFTLRLWRSPFQQVKWKVKAESDAVARFVDSTFRRFWRRSVPRMLHRYCQFGFAPAAAEWCVRRGKVRLDRVQVVEPRDATPLVFDRGRHAGRMAGFRLTARGGARCVTAPHAIWYAGQQEYGAFHDAPLLAGMYDPWAEKNTRGGALDTRRLGHWKYAFSGDVIRHPKGTQNFGTDEQPQVRDNQDVAREALESIYSGSGLTLSNEPNQGMPGEYAWKVERGESNVNLPALLEYPKQLDAEITTGGGIPPEVLEAAEVGSGWSGRMISLLTFFGSIDEFVGPMVDAFEPACRYATDANFGNAYWEVEPVPLTDALKEAAGSGPGGGEGPNPLPGLLGTQPRGSGPGGTALRKPVAMSDDRAAGVSAAARKLMSKRKRDLVGLVVAAMVQEQLKASAAGDPDSAADTVGGLAELAGDPDRVREILSAAVEMSWAPYEGPKGGKGWINDQGRVIYGGTKPGEKREKQKAVAAQARALLSKALHHEASPEDLQQLSDHLPALTVGQLRQARVLLNGKFGGGRRRQEMVDRLVEHVKARVEDERRKAAEPPEPEPEPRPAAGAAAKSQKRADGTPANVRVEDVHTVPVASLHRDPGRFQYKVTGIKADGVTDELKGVKTYKPELGGTLLVWRDPADGKDYVINGHHRHELADRTGAETVNARYITAKDAKTARATGALANIAEGRGTAVDAAKYLRDTGSTADDLRAAGVSLSGRVVADAMALRDLGDGPFQRLTEGRLDEAQAVAVARHLKDHKLQDLLFKKLKQREEDGKDWSGREVETAARKMASAGSVTEKGADLFGDFEDEKSTFDQEVELESYAGRLLQQRAGDYAAVANAKRADRVADAGNVLKVDENQKRRERAEQERNVFEQLVNRKGPIADAVRESAAELATAKSKRDKDAVKQRAWERVQQAIGTELDGPGPGGKPAEPAAAKPVGADAGGAGGGGPGRAAAPPVGGGPEPGPRAADVAPAAPAPEPAPAGPPSGLVPAALQAAKGLRSWTGREHAGADQVGSHKPYLSDVYDAVKDRFPGLSEGEFKREMQAANLRGDVSLERIDLNHLADPAKYSRSEIEHLNGTFHVLTADPPKPAEDSGAVLARLWQQAAADMLDRHERATGRVLPPDRRAALTNEFGGLVGSGSTKKAKAGLAARLEAMAAKPAAAPPPVPEPALAGPAPLGDRLAAAATRAKAAALPDAEVDGLLAEAGKLSAADAVELARKVAGVKTRGKADAVREIRAALTEFRRMAESQRV